MTTRPVDRSGGRGRRGFSLLEILLALAILGGSLAMLSQIVSIGSSSARNARDLSIARILCQTKLAEIMLDAGAGISPQAVPETPIESFDSNSLTPFVYRAEVTQAPLDGLLAIRVTVEGFDSDGGPPVVSYSLTRWLVDPMLGLEQLEMEEEALLSGEQEAAI